MDPKLAQAMNDANTVLGEYGLVVGSPNNWSGVWHLYYFDVNTKNCFPVFDPSWQDRELTSLGDLLKGFPEGTKAEVILEWAERNGILED
jgi:hypothetical protein